MRIKIFIIFLIVNPFWIPLLAAEKPAETDKPNIIFIFADDWGWGDLGSHGHPYLKTPNLDKLAEQGTDFHRFTVASGVCSPSRTAVMTGRFPGRFNIDGHFAWVEFNEERNMPDWLNPNVPTLPRFLKNNGYRTAHYGKWHLANTMIPDAPLPGEYGYDDYGVFNCSGPQMFVHDDVKSAIAFMEKSKKENKPFFINLWMHESHSPHLVNPKYRALFPDLEEKDNIYASIIYHADLRIGQLLDKLDELKLTKNTLVVFSSDNGPARGKGKLKLAYDIATGLGYSGHASKGITGGRRMWKTSLFEGGINVPFIARWPGRIKAGKIDNTSLISAVDLLPTFCELGGVKLPKSYKGDGISQVKALMGKQTPGRSRPLFWKKSLIDKRLVNDKWAVLAVVDQNWKLLMSDDGEIKELYDIVKDPLEKNNLLDAHPEVVNRLTKSILEWKKELPVKADSTCFSKYRGKPSLK